MSSSCWINQCMSEIFKINIIMMISHDVYSSGEIMRIHKSTVNDQLVAAAHVIAAPE